MLMSIIKLLAVSAFLKGKTQLPSLINSQRHRDLQPKKIPVYRYSKPTFKKHEDSYWKYYTINNPWLRL